MGASIYPVRTGFFFLIDKRLRDERLRDKRVKELRIESGELRVNNEIREQ